MPRGWRSLRFAVADFTDHNDIRILADERAHRRGEGQPDRRLDLRLVDARNLVFDGSSMVRIFRVGSFRIDSMVASVVVFPLPVGPVIKISPCGSASRRRNVASSRPNNPILLKSSKPRSRGSRRMTTLSPCCVGMVAMRTSISARPTRARAAPS